LVDGSFYTGSDTYNIFLLCRGVKTLLNIDVNNKIIRSQYTHSTDLLHWKSDSITVDIPDKLLYVWCGDTFFIVNNENNIFYAGKPSDLAVKCQREDPHYLLLCTTTNYITAYFGSKRNFHTSVPILNFIHTSPQITITMTETSKIPTPFYEYNPLYFYMEQGSLQALLDSDQPVEMKFYGNPYVFTGRSPNNTCNSTAWCLLDTPLSYNVMTQSSNILSDPSRPTYFSVLADVFKSVSSLTNQTEVDSAFGRYLNVLYASLEPYMPQKVVFNRYSHSIWVINGSSSLLEMGKRGVSVVRADGKCVPADISPCHHCRWSKNGEACTMCPDNGTGVEWITQCADCGLFYSHNTNKQRRLLQYESNGVKVVFSLGGAVRADILTEFPNASLEESYQAFTVTIITLDPQTSLVDVAKAVGAHSNWYFVVNPRAVYNIFQTTSTSETPFSLHIYLVVGIIIGIFVLIICTILLYVSCRSVSGSNSKLPSAINYGSEYDLNPPPLGHIFSLAYTYPYQGTSSQGYTLIPCYGMYLK
jgi:hypothetical protein